MSQFARAVRASSILLALPASVLAQSRGLQGPTVFSQASQIGALSIRAAVVLPDMSIKPLPLMRVVAQRTGGSDSVAAQTGLEGTVVMTLPVGSYTVRATAPALGTRSFSWSIPVVVRQAATQRVELTNATARADSAVQGIADHAGSASAHNQQPASAIPAGGGGTPENSRLPGTSGAPSRTEPNATASSVKRDRRAERAHYRANTSGLFLGLGVDGSVLRSGDLDISGEVGHGVSAQVGWGVTRRLALYVEAATARLTSPRGDYTLRHVDAGARWHFVSPSRALVPFLDVAFSRRDAGNVYYGNLPADGTGVTVGGGLQYFLARTFSLGTRLRWTTGEFSQVRDGSASVNGFEIDAMSARADVGFSWYLSPPGR